MDIFIRFNIGIAIVLQRILIILTRVSVYTT